MRNLMASIGDVAAIGTAALSYCSMRVDSTSISSLKAPSWFDLMKPARRSFTSSKSWLVLMGLIIGRSDRGLKVSLGNCAHICDQDHARPHVYERVNLEGRQTYAKCGYWQI